MLNLKRNFVKLEKNIGTWEEAVRKAAEPLLKNGYIELRYIDSMINNINKNGAYIVIIPGFAMPHSSPEHGVKKTGIAVLKLENPVIFPENNEVKLIVILASENADIHMNIILTLTDILSDEKLMEKIYKTNDIDKLLELL